MIPSLKHPIIIEDLAMSIEIMPEFAANEAGSSAPDSASAPQNAIVFGRFVVSPRSRTLKFDGKDVCIGGRAYDLLMLLVESSGKVVSKAAIMRHVWPTTTVDECNLRFQMTSLRRALGDERDRIKTVTGRGYLFVAEPLHVRRAAILPEDGGISTDDNAPPDKPAIVIIDKDPENRVALQRLLRPFAANVRSYPSMEALLGSRLYG